MIVSGEKPLVSICIPAFNNANVIRFTIESILCQTYRNWELIIQDDCSTDATLSVIKSFADPRITVVENEKNLGFTENWNSVAAKATGEYVKLLGGDDILAPDCIEKQLDIFLCKSYPSVSLVTCYKTVIDENGKALILRKYPFRSGLVNAKKAITRNFLVGTNLIGEPVVGLFKRQVFEEIGYYDCDNAYLIDLDFWLRVLLTGDLYVIPESLVFFRISTGTMTSKLRSQQAALFKQFARKSYNDKRFNLNSVYLIASYINAPFIAALRRLFMYFHST